MEDKIIDYAMNVAFNIYTVRYIYIFIFIFSLIIDEIWD